MKDNMNDNNLISRFDIPYKDININELEYINKYLYNYLYIYNEDFNDDLTKLPENIKILGFYSKNCNLQYLPPQIKWLNLFDLRNNFITPNSLDILYIGHRYLLKFPDILLTISYGLKVLILEVNQDDIKEINLNFLPDTIECIVLQFDTSNITLNLNNSYSNLKQIYISEFNNINNISEIKEYTTNNNNTKLIEGYLEYESIFKQYIYE